MANPDDIKNPGQNSTEPTDQNEDSEERRNAADKSWRDRSAVPGSTPDQVEPAQKRAPEVDVDDIDEKR